MTIMSLYLIDSKLHLPISVSVDVASSARLSHDLAENLQAVFRSRKEKIPAYNHLDFSVDPFPAVSQWFPASWMSCDLSATRNSLRHQMHIASR
jgi:hypothetical protein